MYTARSGIDILRKATLDQLKRAIAQAHVDASELQKKLRVKKIIREMRLAAKGHY